MSQNFESESESTSIIARVVNDGNDTEDDIEEPMPLGFKWCKSKKRIVKIKEEEDMITCMVSSEKCSFEASKESCRSYLNKDSWDTFDEYIEWNDSHKIIE
ncbi:hypothetical protein BpHYR1_051790, partial [Brachionus plicatilis]